MSLLLASASPTRASLLHEAGVPFEVRPARVDEDSVKDSLLAEGAQPRDIADALAELKALRVSASNPGALVLGADQVIGFGSELVSKSSSLTEAAALLRRMCGKSILLVTAAVLAKDSRPIWRHVDRIALTMRVFSEDFLTEYLAQEGETVLGCVGAFRVEGPGLQLFERIEGDYFSILGLPMLPLLTALREQGIIPK